MYNWKEGKYVKMKIISDLLKALNENKRPSKVEMNRTALIGRSTTKVNH
jgi:hypothetical protein